MEAARPGLRIGIITDGLQEITVDGSPRIKNGGVGVYIYNLVTHLLALDRVNDYYLIRTGRGELDIYRGGRAKNVFLAPVQTTLWRCALDLPYRRLVKELDLDLLHYPNQFGGAFPPRRARIIATVHDLTPLSLPQTHPWRRVAAFRLMARRSLARCDRVIVHSQAVARDLIRRRLGPPEAIDVVPLAARPLPLTATTGFDRRYPVGRNFILTVGVLEPRKNHLVLLRALHHLRQRGEPMELVIVGRSGWRLGDPLARPEFSGLRGAVRIFADVQDADLAEFYRRAALFVYPSRYEGFGLPVIEAMAHGVPVVASDTGAIPEVAGDAALLAAPDDVVGLVAQISRLIRDRELASRLAAAGRAQAARFSWRRSAQMTLETYYRACGVERPTSYRSAITFA